MYLADGEENCIRGFQANIDFTEILDFPGVTPDMILDEKICMKSVECKVLNGRKVSFKAMLEVDANVFLNEKEEMIREIRGIEDIESQIVSLQMNSLVGQNTTKASAKENVVIDSTDSILEILNLDLTMKNQDTKISYNKVLAKAEVETRIMYLTEEGRIKSVEESIPVMGFIDLVGVSDDDLCDVKYKLKNVSAKPNSQDHAIALEIEIEMFCRVFGNREIDLIQDMYSPSKNLALNQNKVSLVVGMKNTRSSMSVREKIVLEDAEDSRISDVICTAMLNEKNIMADRVRYEGDLNFRFLLENSDGIGMKAQDVSLPFEFSQEIEGLKQDSKIEVEFSKIFQEFTKDRNEVSTKVDFGVNTNSYQIQTVNVIDEIEEQEGGDDNPYSMVIYFVKEGDTLWKIAKRYKSTVADIVRINQIENPDRLSVGMQLFIPKCATCRSEISSNA